jgi:hypothetical protein
MYQLGIFRDGIGARKKHVPMATENVILILSEREHPEVQQKDLRIIIGYILTSDDRCYVAQSRGFDRAGRVH